MDSIKGSFIDLECIVSGSHPISIQWFKDDQEISASEKYKFSFHDNTAFLEIRHLESTDTGTYTCSATNKAGHNQCSGHLTVKGWQLYLHLSGTYCCLISRFSPVLPCSKTNIPFFFCFSFFHLRTPLLCGRTTVSRCQSQHKGSVKGSCGWHCAHDN